jgi:hypothetical protein
MEQSFSSSLYIILLTCTQLWEMDLFRCSRSIPLLLLNKKKTRYLIRSVLLSDFDRPGSSGPQVRMSGYLENDESSLASIDHYKKFDIHNCFFITKSLL